MSDKLKYNTLREQVALLVRKRIINNQIRQGEKINEAELASELGISRGPVREALRQIEQEGLVTYESNKGCTVKTVCPDDVFNVYVLRANLEILSVKICRGNFSEKTIMQMEADAEEIRCAAEAGDVSRLIEIDEHFHSLIVRESNMERLYDMWSSLNSMNALIFYSVFTAHVFSGENREKHHVDILNAMKRGNEAEICEVIQGHYFETCEKMHTLQKTENVPWQYLKMY